MQTCFTPQNTGALRASAGRRCIQRSVVQPVRAAAASAEELGFKQMRKGIKEAAAGAEISVDPYILMYWVTELPQVGDF
jgi:hypothetical protein